ncbi:MAG: ABC transporter permease, partial [Planktomarina sp.]|nr:ABC transporter permease [Planktomarina sp.]
MSWLMNLVLILIATAVVAWVFRFAGQKFTGNKSFFRDMPFAVAFGYVAGLLVLIAAMSYYFRPVEVNGVPSAGVI